MGVPEGDVAFQKLEACRSAGRWKSQCCKTGKGLVMLLLFIVIPVASVNRVRTETGESVLTCKSRDDGRQAT